MSVIIPVYERTNSLRDAVESVFLQTYPISQIIIVDDGSGYEVYECLKPYFGRIDYIRLEDNRGVSATRNRGVAHSTCEYVAFLDSDDIFLPSKIALQIQHLQSTGLHISHTNEFWFKGDRFINQGNKHARYGGKIFSSVLDMCRVSPSSLLVRKNVFDEVGLFDEALRVCEDYEWTLRASIKYDFGYIEKKLLIKRGIEENSLSGSIKHIESIRLDILETFNKTYGSILNIEETAAIEKELERKRSIVKRNF